MTDVFLDTYALATVPFTVKEQGLDEQGVVEEWVIVGEQRNPHSRGVSTDGTHIFVTDTANQSITKYTESQTYLLAGLMVIEFFKSLHSRPREPQNTSTGLGS